MFGVNENNTHVFEELNGEYLQNLLILAKCSVHLKRPSNIALKFL